MAFSFDSMTAYVEENRADLISKAILGAKTLGLGVDIRSGIKSSEKIPVLESTVPFQAAACSFTSSGTTTFSQVSIATVGIQFAEQLCLNDLNTYFTQKYLPAGANIDSLSIAQQIIDRKIAQVARNVENMIWAGKTTYTNSTVLKQMNGWLATIDTAGTAVAATPSTLNSTNVLTIFDDVYSKVPAAALVNEPVVAFCGYHGWHDWYLAANLKQDNLKGHLLEGLSPNGVPKGLKGTYYPFRYNNINDLKNKINIIIVYVCFVSVNVPFLLCFVKF